MTEYKDQAFFSFLTNFKFKFKHSQDTVLKRLLSKAEHDWPEEMYAESVSEVATRIKNNDHLILISSRLEAKQILSEECGLMKVFCLTFKAFLFHA